MRDSLKFALYCAAIFGCAGILSFHPSSARAGTLNLQPTPPDIYAGLLTSTYTASSGSTGTFSASGWAFSFQYSGTNTADVVPNNNTYDLNVQVDKNTGQLISGSLAVDGTIPSLGASSGTLLTGTATQFAYMSGGGNVFEFLFKPTGGDLLPYFTGNIGVELSMVAPGFTGSFATNFATSGSDASDNFDYVIVPEPTSACLVATGLAFGLAVAARARRRRQIA